MKRSICVITGSRAEYGLLRPLMEEIRRDADLRLQLIVTGTHLSKEFGLTYKEIEKDKFPIDKKIDILLTSDTPVGICRSMGLEISKISKVYEQLRPDIIVVLGDRFEIFSAAAAALISMIPVAHIHGGELTQGVFDDALRHAITKMSHLHFTSTLGYRRRLIQLGESPGRVFKVGALGLDSIKKLKLLSKDALEKELRLKFNKRNLLVTFHPLTLEKNTSKIYFQNLLDVLRGLKDTRIIFTKSNADTQGSAINAMIDDYVSKNASCASAFASLGQTRYLSAMQFVDAVVGNSSSGIIEAPSFKIGTINIGDRQEGRIKAGNVIDCSPSREAIRGAINKLYSKEFQKILKSVTNPYGYGNAAGRIKSILKGYDLKNILKKKFHDVSFV